MNRAPTRSWTFAVLAIGAVLLGALVTILAALWRADDHRLPSGSTAEWAAAVAEAGGAIGSVLVVVVAVLALRDERGHTAAALDEARNAVIAAQEANRFEGQRWQDELDGRARQQAASVGLFIDRSRPPLGVMCSNDSTALIYDVRAFIVIAGMRQRGAPQGPNLAPGERQSLVVNPRVSAESSTIAINHHDFGITFRDNAGAWWEKRDDLILTSDPSAAEVTSTNSPAAPPKAPSGG